MTNPPAQIPASERYQVAFVIQGDDIFKITADNILHSSSNGASDAAFDGVAKLKAAAALMQLTNIHKERPNELRKMARELAAEGMRLLARSTASARPVAAVSEMQVEATVA